MEKAEAVIVGSIQALLFVLFLLIAVRIYADKELHRPPTLPSWLTEQRMEAISRRHGPYAGYRITNRAVYVLRSGKYILVERRTP